MSRPETIEELNEEAELIVSIARLIRGLEGVKDWAARSGATGLEQWCSEALSPTGKLAVFPPTEKGDLISRRLHHRELTDKDATIKALADVLWMSSPRRLADDSPCWCYGERPAPGHMEHCESRRAALRLAGRLP